jgi:predicted ATPase
MTRKPLSKAARAAIEKDERVDPHGPIGREISENLRHSHATRREVLDVVEMFATEIKGLRTRIDQLERALAFAQAEAETALSTSIDVYLEETG